MQNRTHNTKSMVEAGLISALIFVIFLISVATGMLTSMGAFILPIPIAILYYRYDFKTAILTVVVSFIISSLLYNIFYALIAAVTIGLVGISLGYCIKNNISKKKTIITLSIANMISIVLNMTIIVSFIFQQSFIKRLQMIVDMFNESIDLSIDFYSTMGMTAEQLQLMESTKSLVTVESIMKLMPTSLIFLSVSFSLIIYSLTGIVFSKLKYKKLEKFKEFQYFYISNIITGILIITWLSSALLMHFKIEFGSSIEISVLAIMQTLFVLNGFALIIYFLRVRLKKRIPKAIIILIGFFLFSTPVFASTLFFIGLIESIIDLRRLDPYSVRKNKVGD